MFGFSLVLTIKVLSANITRRKYVKPNIPHFLQNSVNYSSVSEAYSYRFSFLYPNFFSVRYSMSRKNSRHSYRNIDLSNAHRGVWLVKVPKYVADRWEKNDRDSEVAKLRIEKIPGKKPEISLCSSSTVLNNNKAEGEDNIPRDHKLQVSTISQQTLGVFSHVMHDSQDSRVPEKGKLFMEGVITQKLVCTAQADNSYMEMKMNAIRKAAIPNRTTIQLNRTVQTYKPVSNHKNNIEHMERKKAEGKKTRDDRDKVMDMLFGAFEKHQYYNIKDLVRITKQPVTYLKEIMRDVCNYNLKQPHRNMWELKPEYRHYKQTEPAAAIDCD